MNKLMKICVLSLALIASLLLLQNTVNATVYPGTLTLKILGSTSHCEYGTSLNFGVIQASTYSSSVTGIFIPDTFYCSDNFGTAGAWTMSLQATSDLTGQYGQTIPRTGIYLKTYPTTMTGYCMYSIGTTGWQAIDTAQTIVGKTSATGNVCTLTVTGVQLYIIVPSSQAVGVYTGTISLDAPF